MIFYFIIKNKIIVLVGRSIELGWGVIILSKITQIERKILAVY